MKLKKKQREKNTKITSKKILVEAASLISKNGIKSFSILKISENLSMSHANIYRHFRSKNILTLEIGRMLFNEIQNSSKLVLNVKFENKIDFLATFIIITREAILNNFKTTETLSILKELVKYKPEVLDEYEKYNIKIIQKITGFNKSKSSIILNAFDKFINPIIIFSYKNKDVDHRIYTLCTLLLKN